MATEVDKFFSDLDGGHFETKLSAILSEVAGAVIDHGKKGEITITMTFKQIANSAQVFVDHELRFKRPTKRGESGEKELTSTPMYVGRNGRLSFFMEDQGVMFGKHGEVSKDTFPNKTKD